MHPILNLPLFSIILTLMAAVITSLLRPRAARIFTAAIILLVSAMSACVLVHVLRTGESTAYMMGHFPAPWGNEIRIGVFEALTIACLMPVFLFSFLGGMKIGIQQIEQSKYNLFCISLLLILLSLQALVYTNDVFTAFVFLEISTLAAAGLVMSRQIGRGLVAAMRYMIMNLLGSSLFLIGIVVLYTVTGHLLMSPVREQVAALHATGQYRVALQLLVGLITAGLAVKSALFPFDQWLPGAYGNATPTGSAILSSIVSKGYIFLLIKVYVRVIGMDVIRDLGICDVLFAYGAFGMVMGSVHAVRAKTVRMMVAYSSAAQIGYIYIALGLGTEMGIVVAVWHVLAHAMLKSMLFIAASRLDLSSGGSHWIADLRGGFYRSPAAALAFALGAFAMAGVPMLSVFVTKITLAQGAVAVGGRHMIITLVCLTISTFLNVLYFMRSGVMLFIPEREKTYAPAPSDALATASLIGFIVMNLAMGAFAAGIFSALGDGLSHFA